MTPVDRHEALAAGWELAERLHDEGTMRTLGHATPRAWASVLAAHPVHATTLRELADLLDQEAT